ncbi:MAG TPA: STAS domain-containing protein [Candidatus Xenobia bacterium]|jgi:stage II sporulation protein AA (anti-sigma F factor antagonist)
MSDEETLLDAREPQNGIQVVGLLGELDYSNLETVRQQVYQLINGVTALIIDLRSLEFIDSNGLGLLLAAHKRMREKGGRVALVSTSTHIEKLLRISGLETIIPVFKDEPSALDAMAKEVNPATPA